MYWFGWDRVNFLHSGLYGAMFWICGQNSIGNNTHVLAIAEQCLHSVKGFSAPHPAPPASRLGWRKTGTLFFGPGGHRGSDSASSSVCKTFR